MNIIAIANKIKQNGGTLYLVGGAVRDKIMQRQNHDEDYVVVGITSSKFKELFPEAYTRGKSFEVFDIEGKEFALARKETKIGVGHTEFQIEANPTITIEDDLARRDLTINSIAINVLTGECIDPYGGQKDIKNKIIRKTTKHFAEDPLRVYRAARFAAELSFEIEEETINAMHSLKHELNELSSERVFVEFRKALLTNKPSIFFNALKKAEVLDVHFYELYKLIGVKQPVEYHPEGDAYNHTMLVLDMAAELTKEKFLQDRKAEIRFAALVHDFGKGVTPVEEYPHHYNHEKNGIEEIRKFCRKLKVPTRFIKCGITSSLEHMKGGIFNKMKPATQVTFIERVSKSILGLDGLQIIVDSDRLSNKDFSKEIIYEKSNFEEIGNETLQAINGDDIKEKYNIEDGLKLKEKLHQERVSYIKYKSNLVTS